LTRGNILRALFTYPNIGELIIAIKTTIVASKLYILNLTYLVILVGGLLTRALLLGFIGK